jgi:hypothetical protein
MSTQINPIELPDVVPSELIIEETEALLAPAPAPGPTESWDDEEEAAYAPAPGPAAVFYEPKNVTFSMSGKLRAMKVDIRSCCNRSGRPPCQRFFECGSRAS